MAGVPPDELTYEATDLNETIDYYFRVSAKNKHGVSSPLETESTVKPKSRFGEYRRSCALISFVLLRPNGSYVLFKQWVLCVLFCFVCLFVMYMWMNKWSCFVSNVFLFFFFCLICFNIMNLKLS